MNEAGSEKNPTVEEGATQSVGSHRAKAILIVVVAILSIAFAVGLKWAFSGGAAVPVGAGWYIFAYTMGLTMIVLPCTLPLAFVIVPLSMGKGVRKGISVALAFAVGVTITLSLYGVAAAALGDLAIDTLGADLETVKNIMYVIAGAFAIAFALGELGFIKVRMPTYKGAAPMFIQRQGDVLKAVLLGLFMGNVGVGCPHPATPLIFTRIAVSGDVFYGWLLFFVHALGRITPLLILALLGILGVNGLTWVMKRRKRIEEWTGWAMVFVAGFIFTLGYFTHDWWVNSGMHSLVEELTQEESFLGALTGSLGAERIHAHGLAVGTGMFGAPLWLGNWVLVALWIIPMWWWYARKKRALRLAEGREDGAEQNGETLDVDAERVLMPWRFWFLFSTSLLLFATFTFYLPLRFLHNQSIQEDRVGEVVHDDTDGHDDGATERQRDTVPKQEGE